MASSHYNAERRGTGKGRWGEARLGLQSRALNSIQSTSMGGGRAAEKEENPHLHSAFVTLYTTECESTQCKGEDSPACRVCIPNMAAPRVGKHATRERQQSNRIFILGFVLLPFMHIMIMRNVSACGHYNSVCNGTLKRRNIRISEQSDSVSAELGRPNGGL